MNNQKFQKTPPLKFQMCPTGTFTNLANLWHNKKRIARQ